MNKWVALSLAVVGPAALSFCVVAPEKGSEAAPAKASGAPEMIQTTNVTRLYNETCGKCHGENGEGGGAGTKTLLTEEKFDQKYDRPFFDAIKNGVPDMGMEAYGGSLTDEQIWGQVVHIRELQARYLRSQKGSSRATNGVYSTKLHGYRIETIVDQSVGLSTPWSIDWLPDGRALLTNRSGSMLVLKGKAAVGRVNSLPKSIEQGQGGLMEVAVHPQYAQNGWIYLSLADPAKSGNGALTKIVRGKLTWQGDDATWGSEQTIYEAGQEFYNRAGVHFGSKIAFDGKGKVWFTIGERGGMMRAQEPTTPYGKTYRVNEDGSIPADNPFPGNPMWSLGHRNQQGLAFDSEGNLWVTEHGPRGGDELNMIAKGANYGWPVVAFSINYNDSPFRTPWPKDDLKVTQPVFRWLPSIGASGLDLVTGNAFPKWKGDLLAGGLSGANVDRFRVKGGKLIEREEILHGMGRVRDIKTASDGTIYLVMNGPDRVIRLVPAS